MTTKKPLRESGKMIRVSPETHARLKKARFKFEVETLDEVLQKLLEEDEKRKKEKKD